MKILLISNMYPSDTHEFYGIFVKNFELKMEKDGVKIDKAVIRGTSKNKLEKVSKYIHFFIDVIKLIRKNDFDLIYIHYMQHSLLPLIPFVSKITKPIVINAHGSDVMKESLVGNIINKITINVINKATLIVTPSDYLKKLLSQKFKIKMNKIFVSPSGGVNMEIFKKNNISRDNQIFTIGYVSRIDEGKGWDVLLKASKELFDRGIKQFQVKIAGSGIQEKQLLEMIASFGLTEHVAFIGSIKHIKLVNYYNQMDLFVFPTTLKESLGLVGIEAMACGLPVIGSNIGGLISYIHNGFNGELFEANDYKQLSQKIEYFMKLDETKYKQYSNNAINTAKEFDSKLVNINLKNKLLSIGGTH